MIKDRERRSFFSLDSKLEELDEKESVKLGVLAFVIVVGSVILTEVDFVLGVVYPNFGAELVHTIVVLLWGSTLGGIIIS